MSELAPAVYEADKFYKVPRMTDEGYIDVVFDICKKENITGVLSLIDPELSLLDKHKQDFEKMGVTVIGSSYQLCELALDKMKMYKWLNKHGYNCAKTYIDINELYVDLEKGSISFPVFVKPNRGSASTNAYIAGGICDVGSDIFERGLCLPSDNKMTPEQQDIIIEAIKSCF